MTPYSSPQNQVYHEYWAADRWGLFDGYDETAYNRFSVQASRYLDRITMDRVKECPTDDKVKLACCALADAYRKIEQLESKVLSDSKELSSETVGKLSRSYRDQSAFKKSAGLDGTPQKLLMDAAAGYLWSTGLLYRGVD